MARKKATKPKATKAKADGTVCVSLSQAQQFVEKFGPSWMGKVVSGLLAEYEGKDVHWVFVD